MGERVHLISVVLNLSYTWESFGEALEVLMVRANLRPIQSESLYMLPQVMTANGLHQVLTLKHASDPRGELAHNPDGGSPHPQAAF